MNLTTWLEAAFDYELWADQVWLKSCPNMPEPLEAEKVLAHILWALETWLVRIVPKYVGAGANLDARFETVCREWKATLSSRDLDEIVTYRNTKGTEYSRKLGAIALHVINHGTYHRGQLRGIADRQRYPDFPETDLNIFFIENHIFGLED